MLNQPDQRLADWYRTGTPAVSVTWHPSDLVKLDKQRAVEVLANHSGVDTYPHEPRVSLPTWATGLRSRCCASTSPVWIPPRPQTVVRHP